MEETLREARELHSNIFDSMSDGIAVLDREFRIVAWNAAMEKTSGVLREELIGSDKRAWEIFPHLSAQGMDELMQRAMRGETVARDDVPFDVPGRKEGFTSETYHPLRSPSGEIRGIVCVIRDVTEKLLAERTLRESEQRFRQMAESLGVVLWICNFTRPTRSAKRRA